MSKQYFKAVIGPQRVSPSLDPNAADYIPILDAQMAGIRQNMTNIIKAAQHSTQDILHDALMPTFDKAYNYCPELTGELRESGYLESNQMQNGQLTIEMGFGKNNSPPYTIFVHERTDLKHKAPTCAKFMQRALEEDSDEIPKRIQAGYQELMNGG